MAELTATLKSRWKASMSLFSTIETECPACEATSKYELVFSVNADRRPELRAEIMARTFQRLTCPECGGLFRLEPEFTYFSRRGEAVPHSAAGFGLPAAGRNRKEARAVATFSRFWGPGADPVAAQIGSELGHRVVFGWGSGA